MKRIADRPELTRYFRQYKKTKTRARVCVSLCHNFHLQGIEQECQIRIKSGPSNRDMLSRPILEHLRCENDDQQPDEDKDNQFTPHFGQDYKTTKQNTSLVSKIRGRWRKKAKEKKVGWMM